MTTGATLFSGFEGAGLGMRAAGASMLWGIEQRADVAAVAERNGFNSIVADILTVDPATMERADCLHASPPCTNASNAKTDGKESDLDQALARKTVEFIRVLKPDIFTLENVWQYRKFVSFGIILGALEALGYWVDVAHCNSADFSVPQTRKRLILRARLGGMLPHLPNPEPWRGWYQAIEDLIPSLPDSSFAPWQVARLPENIKTFMMAGSGNTNFEEAFPGNGVFEINDPSPTIASSGGGRTPRAFLVHPTDARTMPIVDSTAPAFTTVSNNNFPRAFLVDGQNARTNGEPTVRNDTEPSMSVSASTGGHGMARAWLAQGRVVKLTPRCLARFQSFPDSYRLSGKTSLDCYGIGNAVPPLLAQKIYQGLMSV